MAIQFENFQPNQGQRASANINRGLGEGINGLLSNKLNSMLKQQKHAETSNALKALGIPNHEQIAALDPALLKGVIDYHQKTPEREAYGKIASQLFGNQEGNNAPAGGDNAQGNPQTPGKINVPSGTQLTGGSLDKLMKIEQDRKTNALKQEELGLKKEKNEAQLSKDYREFIKPYNEIEEKSRNNIKDYKSVIQLAKKGTVRNGANHQLLSLLGMENFFQNVDTQIAGKLYARLAQNVAGVFGTNSRVTNFLEQTFQRSLPSLWNTNEGAIAISEINMLSDEANIVKAENRKKILADAKGKIPPNIDDMVNEASRPQLDKLEQQAIDIATKATQVNNKSVESIEKKYPAAKYPDKIQHNKNGQVLVSHNGQWQPAEYANGKWVPVSLNTEEANG